MSTSDTLALTINGEPRTVPADLTVEGLLRHLALEPRMIVVERNGEILRRDAYEGASLAEGDALELVQFVGGG